MNLTAEQLLARRSRGVVRQAQETITGPTSALESRVGAASAGVGRAAPVPRRTEQPSPPLPPEPTDDLAVAQAYAERARQADFERRALAYRQRVAPALGGAEPTAPVRQPELAGRGGLATAITETGRIPERTLQVAQPVLEPIHELTRLLASGTIAYLDPNASIPVPGQPGLTIQGQRYNEEMARFREANPGRNPTIPEFTTIVSDAANAPPGLHGALELAISSALPPFGAVPVERAVVSGLAKGVRAVRAGAAEALVRVPALPVQEAGLRLAGARGGIARGAAEEIIPPAGIPAEAPIPEVPEVAKAANIRLDKYPEDIRSTIKDWADAHPAKVEAAGRGVRSDVQVLADAKVLVEDMGGNFAKLQKRWKPGEAWNAEEITAIRGTLDQATEKAMAAAKAAQADNSATNHVQLLIALQEQSRVQGIVHGVTAEAGRSLRAFRQEAFDAMKANDTQRLEKLLRLIAVNAGKGWNTRAKLDEIAAGLAHLDMSNPAAVNEFIRSMSKPRLWDYVMELYINSILFGPTTHIINTLSNAVQVFASPVERLASATFEPALARLSGREIDRFFAEVPADAFGALQGIPEGARTALFVIRNGITPGQAAKYEFRRTAFRGRLGKIIRIPGTVLEAADAFFYAVNYRAALHANAIRVAKREGLNGAALLERAAALTSQPTEDAIRAAIRTAEYRLFRQEPGEWLTAIMNVREKIPPMRFVLPFLRTPTNLFKYGLERSPVGVFNPRLWSNIAKKDPEVADQLGRLFIGSLLAASTASLALSGRLTGAVPRQAAARDRFYREGKLPFAIKVGNTWVSYQRLEPLNQPLAQAAATMEALRAGDEDAAGKVEVFVRTLSHNLISQTYLSGLSDLLNMVNEPERYGTGYLQRLVAGLVPASALLRAGARLTDVTVRRPQTLSEQLRTGLPGLSKTVPPRLTAFGEEVTRESPALSPIQFTPEKQSAVDKELERLGIEVGFVGKTIAGLDLTREEQQRYQQLAGQATYARLLALVDNSAYLRLSNADKEKVIRRAIEQTREGIRERLIREPALLERLRQSREPAGVR